MSSCPFKGDEKNNNIDSYSTLHSKEPTEKKNIIDTSSTGSAVYMRNTKLHFLGLLSKKYVVLLNYRAGIFLTYCV